MCPKSYMKDEESLISLQQIRNAGDQVQFPRLPDCDLNPLLPGKGSTKKTINVCSGKFHPFHQWDQFHLRQNIHLVNGQKDVTDPVVC